MSEMKPFVSNEELPEPNVKVSKKTGKSTIIGVTEPRYLIRMTATAYKLVKVVKKPHGILHKHCHTMSRKNKAHVAQFKKYKEAGIPVI